MEGKGITNGQNSQKKENGQHHRKLTIASMINDVRVRIGLLILCALLLLFQCFTIYTLKTNFRNLESQYQTILSNVSSITGSMDGQIGSLSDEIKKNLEKQSSVISDFQMDIKDVYSKGQMIKLGFSTTPRMYTEGMKVSFQVELNEDTVMVEGKKGEGFSFVGETLVPWNDNTTVTVVLNNGISILTEKTFENHYFRSEYLLPVSNLSNTGAFGYTDGVVMIDQTYSMSVNGVRINSYNYKVENNVSKAILYVDINGKPVKSVNMAEGAESIPEYGYFQSAVTVQEEIPMLPGDLCEIYAIVEDNFGIRYKCYGDTFYINENGEMEENFQWKEAEVLK